MHYSPTVKDEPYLREVEGFNSWQSAQVKRNYSSRIDGRNL